MPTRRGKRFRRGAEARARPQAGSQLGLKATEFIEIILCAPAAAEAAVKPVGRGLGVEIF
jgi:hypothetical protein